MSLQGFYTTKGLALAAKLSAGTKLTVTKVTAGSGTTAASAQTLADTRQTLSVGTATLSGQTATLPVTLTEADATVSYSLRELGVYATDPDEGEILYQVFRLSEAYGVTALGEGTLRFYLRQTVGSGGITVTCSPAGLLTEEDIAPLQAKVMTTSSATRNVTLTAGGLQAYINALPRLLTESITITVSGTVTEQLQIYYFHGGGKLTIQAAERGGCVFKKGVRVISSVPIIFTNCKFSNPDAAQHSDYELAVERNSLVNTVNCDFSGNTHGSALGVSHNSIIIVHSGCTLRSYAYAVIASYGGTAIFCAKAKDTSGNSNGAWVWNGGIVLLGSEANSLLGGSTNSHSGGIIANASGSLV